MPSLHAEVVTIKGPVTVDYSRIAGTRQSIVLKVSVPHNTKAKVEFEPLIKGGSCVMLKEGNSVIFASADQPRRLQQVDGVNAVSMASDGAMSVSVGAGTYHFTANWQ